MKLSKSHWLVRLAYTPELLLASKEEPFQIPSKSTLCELIGAAIFKNALFFFMFGPVFGCLYCVMFPAIWIDESLPKTRFGKWVRSQFDKSVIVNAIRDFKNKSCTRIEIE